MKKSVTIITLLLLIAGLLSGCGKNTLEEPPEDLPKESLSTETIVESESEVFTAESETVETQPKFNIAKDVLLSYEYNSNGELSKVIFIRDVAIRDDGVRFTDDDIWEFKDFNVTYDISGYLKSIQTKTVDKSLKSAKAAVSIESEYNADGQIISLVVTYKPYGLSAETHDYEVVYNSFDDFIKVYITTPSRTENRVYDSNYNYVSYESFYKIGSKPVRAYVEYTNGLISRYRWYNDDSSGQLRSDITYYDNGKINESYFYDNNGDLQWHTRYNRKGEKILSE